MFHFYIKYHIFSYVNITNILNDKVLKKEPCLSVPFYVNLVSLYYYIGETIFPAAAHAAATAGDAR